MISRRDIICYSTLAVASSIAGCGGRLSSRVQPRLKVFAEEIERMNSSWRLQVRVENAHYQEVGAHNVEIIAFSDTGEKVCQTKMGDFDQHRRSRRGTVLCNHFPAIISIIADESPCADAQLQTIYWVGTDEQRSNPSPHVIVWKSYYWECDEPHPIDRALERVARSESNWFNIQPDRKGRIINSE